MTSGDPRILDLTHRLMELGDLLSLITTEMYNTSSIQSVSELYPVHNETISR